MLLGVSAIAIAQPVFDVISNSPEFFAARGTTAFTAVSAILIICFGVPLGLLALERAVRWISRTAAALLFGAVLAALIAVIVMPWLRGIEALAFPRDCVAAVLAGIVVAVTSARINVVRQFLMALAPAVLVVPLLFLANPAVKQSLLPPPFVAPVQTIERTPPIVFVIFDELPLNSLLTARGDLDAGRYPHFAELARDSYWFRNATTVASNTSHAVPAILSGRYPTMVNDLPTLQFYPVNLFTTLAPRYDINASFRFQNLCPPRTCHNAANSSDTIRLLLSDLGLVWLHIVLPPALTDALPPVTDDWAEFRRDGSAEKEESGGGRGGLFAQFLSSIDQRPARLHFIHSMLPHMAFEYVPSGRRYRLPDRERLAFRRTGLFEGASAEYADTIHQRHLAQVGFVDRLVGDLLRRLHDEGVYDDALIIITADHGASYREGRARRVPQQGLNLADILSVPLFVKLPGQHRGESVDRIVETVDILPTILDVIRAKSSLTFDGRSLVDDRIAARPSRTFVWRNRLNVEVRTVEDLAGEGAASRERKERRFGSGDFTGLYAPPLARQWLGARRSALHAAPGVRIGIRNSTQFQAVALTRDPLPLFVSGVLHTSRAAPVMVAVVVNGIVAAVTYSYQQRGAHQFGTLIPETSLRDGKNVVAAVALEENAATP